MSAYLGNTKVNLSPMPQPYNFQMGSTIQGKFDNQAWVRPQGWPNLDLIEYPQDMDYIYATYDTSLTGSIALYITGTNITCTIGHLDNNNQYVVDQTLTPTNNQYNKSLSTYTGYPIVRVLGTSITKCVCYSITNDDGATQDSLCQPFVERVAYLPHATSFSGTSQTWGSRYLQREKISNGDGLALTNGNNIWYRCISLRDLDISSFYTPNVTSLSSTFEHCIGLSSLDLSHWKVDKVTTLYNTFYYCINAKIINLTGWNTIKITSLCRTFYHCRHCQHILGIQDFNTSLVTTFYGTFYYCYSLKQLPIDKWDTSKVNNITTMFCCCANIKQLDLSSWDISKLTTLNANGLFLGCYNLQNLKLFTWPPAISDCNQMFDGCYNLPYIDLTGIKFSGSGVYRMFGNCRSLKELHFPDTFSTNNLSSASNKIAGMFTGCSALKTITGIKNWQFNVAGSFSSMFSNCFSLKNLDISGWKVDTMTTFSGMFDCCYSLEELDLSAWVISNNATNFSTMFRFCRSLKTINTDGSNWDTSNVTTMSEMFRECYSLTSIPNIANWNLNKITTFYYTFSDCRSISQAIFPNLNLPACTRVDYMFQNNYLLQKINFSNWSMPAITTNLTSFLYSYRLTTIIGITIPDRNIAVNCATLTHDSLLVLLNALPTASAARTLTIGTGSLSMLSDTDIAIATNKGWTIATA